MDNNKRILYIEDNYQNRRLVRRILTPKGYEVLEAEDGLQGIAMAAREKPALILMDINLPGIDGMEATSRLKSSPDLAHIPIVAVTAAAMRGDREKIIASGCDDYLQKPIDNEALLKLVQRFIGPGVPGTSKPTRVPVEHSKPVDDAPALAPQPTVPATNKLPEDAKGTPSEPPKVPTTNNIPEDAKGTSTELPKVSTKHGSSLDAKRTPSELPKISVQNSNPLDAEPLL